MKQLHIVFLNWGFDSPIHLFISVIWMFTKVFILENCKSHVVPHLDWRAALIRWWNPTPCLSPWSFARWGLASCCCPYKLFLIVFSKWCSVDGPWRVMKLVALLFIQPMAHLNREGKGFRFLGLYFLFKVLHQPLSITYYCKFSPHLLTSLLIG
jgi:hypothetical protein